MNKKQFEQGIKRLYYVAWAILACIVLGSSAIQASEILDELKRDKVDRDERIAWAKSPEGLKYRKTKLAEIAQQESRIAGLSEYQLAIAEGRDISQIQESAPKQLRSLSAIAILAIVGPGVFLLIFHWIYRGFIPAPQK